MEPVYVVIENGDVYPEFYVKYVDAVAAVKLKHSEYLISQIKELNRLFDIEDVLFNINVPENTETGISSLYIEKGINIIIRKLSRQT